MYSLSNAAHIIRGECAGSVDGKTGSAACAANTIKSAGDVCGTGDEFEGAQPSRVIVDIGHDHEFVGACLLDERLDARANRVG